jgi:hypothetical protein
MSKEVMEQTFQVSKQCRLSVSNIRGAVVVVGGSEDTIQVMAVKDTSSGDSENTLIKMEQDDEGEVRLEVTARNISGWMLGSKPCKVDFTITAPSSCSLKAMGVSSSLLVEDLQGKFKIKTVSGPVRLQRLNGELDVDAVSGDILADTVVGELVFKTVSGGFRINQADLIRFSGSTVSGNVEIHSALNEGTYNLRSVSGSVRLFLPQGNGCTVRTNSLSGRLRSNIPSSRTRTKGNEKETELVGGGPLVLFHSISGDLWIEYPQAETGAPGRARNEEQEYKDEDPVRLGILEQIEAGKLSVEEGLERLKSL